MFGYEGFSFPPLGLSVPSISKEVLPLGEFRIQTDL